MKKNRLIIAIVAVCVILIVIPLLVRMDRNYREMGRFFVGPRYVRDYAAAIGLPCTAPSFDTLVEIFGQPCSTDFSGPRQTARFNGLGFAFIGHGGAQAIWIYDPAIRFGRHQIGVGSTKREIERAYRRFDIIEESNEELYALMVVDGITWLSFYLDESNIVEMISITFYGP